MTGHNGNHMPFAYAGPLSIWGVRTNGSVEARYAGKRAEEACEGLYRQAEEPSSEDMPQVDPVVADRALRARGANTQPPQARANPPPTYLGEDIPRMG